MGVIQYPHIGRIYKPADITYNNGDAVAGELTLDFDTICRIEPRTGSQYIEDADGRRVSFFGIVYMPLSSKQNSSFTPSIITNTYAGQKILYVVPVDVAPGITDVDIPALEGKSFNLVMNGHPLIATTEFTIKPTGGFSLQAPAGTLMPLQRFELEVYYTLTTTGVGGTINAGTGYVVNPGLLFEVWEGTRLITKRNVIQFSRAQLNMRVWL